LIEAVRQALYCSKICSYAQGGRYCHRDIHAHIIITTTTTTIIIIIIIITLPIKDHHAVTPVFYPVLTLCACEKA
jgi:hypothetical protein